LPGTSEAEARRRLVEAQRAFDAAQANLRGCPPTQRASVSAALEGARAELTAAGRELREAREAARRAPSR